MLQLSIALLFAFAGAISLAVVGQSLRRTWLAIGPLRRELALAEADTITLRIVEPRRPAPTLRLVATAASSRRTAPEPCALRAAA